MGGWGLGQPLGSRPPDVHQPEPAPPSRGSLPGVTGRCYTKEASVPLRGVACDLVDYRFEFFITPLP